MRKGPSLSGKYLTSNFSFASKQLQDAINKAEKAGRYDALVAATQVVDLYIYQSLAPHVVERTPVDTGALAQSLAAPDNPGAIFKGAIGDNGVMIQYGTKMNSELRYDLFGPGQTGNGPGKYPYYYPQDIEDEYHFMAEGRRYFSEVLRGSALAAMKRAILRTFKR